MVNRPGAPTLIHFIFGTSFITRLIMAGLLVIGGKAGSQSLENCQFLLFDKSWLGYERD